MVTLEVQSDWLLSEFASEDDFGIFGLSPGMSVRDQPGYASSNASIVDYQNLDTPSLVTMVEKTELVVRSLKETDIIQHWRPRSTLC